MPPQAELVRRYHGVTAPTAIVAGEADEIVDTPFHSIGCMNTSRAARCTCCRRWGTCCTTSRRRSSLDIIHDVAARLAFREAKEAL